MLKDCRAAAARVVAEVMAGKSLNQALPEQQANVAERDRGLLQELSYGSLRLWPQLEGIASQLLDKPLRSKDQDILALIVVGLYQLAGTRVPDHAAVASTVSATRSLGKAWARGLVNALLRRYLRERDRLEAALDSAQRAAHPAWLLQRIERQWPEQVSAIIAANNSRPPMILRVNQRQITREAYQSELNAAGIESRPGEVADSALYLAQPTDVAQLPQFAQGQASVQDEAAQLAAIVLDAQPGERVLDACAAPGGKSGHILERQRELDELVCLEIDAARAQRVEDNLARIGLPAALLVGDAAQPPAELEAASFDRILADVPCSASGVIRRHPDIKLLRRKADIPQLAAEQGRILDGLWPLLKPGGYLLYVTCSLLDEENSDVVQAFLQRQSNASLAMPELSWGEPRAAGIQLLPAEGGHDGLFFARLRKSP